MKVLFTIFCIAVTLKISDATSCTTLPTNYEGTCINNPGFSTCAGVEGRNGWESMTNNGHQPDSFSCGADAEDKRTGNRVIDNSEPDAPQNPVHSGSQSWWFKRGYDSPGPHTGCSASCATCGETSGTFSYSVWFKSADPTCQDGSRMSVVPAPSDCSDRSNLYLEIKNRERHGLEVVTYEHNGLGTWGGAYKSHHDTVALSCDAWHQLECTITEHGPTHTVSAACSVDGVELRMEDTPFFTKARQTAPYDYTASARVKFQPRHSNYDASFKGFLFDDLKVSKTTDGTTSSYETSFEQTSYPEDTVCQNVSCKGDTSTTFNVTCATGVWTGQSCTVLNTCRDANDLYISNGCGSLAANAQLPSDNSKTCGEIRNLYVNAGCCGTNLDKIL